MNVQDRVREDEASGDLASAKNRLASHAVTTHFDPSICEQIARLCLRMHDPIEAGRWYLLCDSTDVESAACIEKFMATCGGVAGQVLSQLPRGAKLKPLENWTPTAGARLRELGFKHHPPPSKPTPSSRFDEFVSQIGSAGCLGVIVILIGLVIIGLRTVADWLR